MLSEEEGDGMLLEVVVFMVHDCFYRIWMDVSVVLVRGLGVMMVLVIMVFDASPFLHISLDTRHDPTIYN